MNPLCSRCNQYPVTAGQRWCKHCKRASKTAQRASWLGAMSQWLRRPATQPPLPAMEREPSPTSQSEKTAGPGETRTLTLSLSMDSWTELMEHAGRDGMSVDAWLSRRVQDLATTYAWFGLLPQTPKQRGMA